MKAHKHAHLSDSKESEVSAPDTLSGVEVDEYTATMETVNTWLGGHAGKIKFSI